MSLSSAQHKVFLQKRSSSGDMKPVTITASATPINCSICNDQFNTARELGTHILSAHDDGVDPSASINTPTPTPPPMVTPPLPALISPPSPKQIEVNPSFHSKSQITKESIKPDPEERTLPSLNLPRAPNVNEVKQKFMVYRLSDTSSRFICLVCSKMYTSRYNIRMHMNLHTGNNVYTCTFCNRNFAHKHVYESHVRTHTGERPFQCGRCSRRFGDRSNCSSHQKRCTGDMMPPSPTNFLQYSSNTHDDVKEEVVYGESHNIAPNVSITPINKMKQIKTYPAKLQAANNNNNSNSTLDSYIQDYMENSLNGNKENNHMEIGFGFEPQIVSVESITGTTSFGDFPNMDEMEGMMEDDDDSEEIQIEPDISLDYDDIEEVVEENEPPQMAIKASPTSLVPSIHSFAKAAQTSIFTCSFCNVRYSQQAMLLDHLTQHINITQEPTQEDLEVGYMTMYYSSRPKFMCLSCGKLFITAESVKLHLNVHFEDQMYTCEMCEKIFAHKHVYENHIKTSHSSGLEVEDEFEAQVYDCKFCDAILPSMQSLNTHTRACIAKPLQITPMNTNEDTKVAILDKPKKKALKPPPRLILLNSLEHIKTEEGRLSMSSVTDSPVIPAMPILILPKPTPKTLISEAAHKIFQASSNGLSSMPSSRRSGGLVANPRAHKIIDTEDGRLYTPDTNSNNIVNLENIEPEPSDSEKKKGFFVRTISTGQQRYICVDCGKHYTTSYNVRMHRNIHSGKNLYSCKFCKKEFSHKHVWETHERVHTGERPFKCPTCPKDFADRSNYNSHKKICLRLQQEAMKAKV